MVCKLWVPWIDLWVIFKVLFFFSPKNKVDFENYQLDIEHVFMKIEENFYNDTENLKSRGASIYIQSERPRD